MINSFATSHTDQMHRLQWALFQAEAVKESWIVQITSSRFGEGVTTISLALGSSMANLFGQDSTLVVEANLRQPAFHNILGVMPKIPMTNLLEAGSGSLDAVSKIENLGFSVLPAGVSPIDGGSVGPEFYMERMGQIFAELRTRFRFIIVDAPPVVPFVDSDIVAGFVDSVAIVVEANSTKSEVLNITINRLRAVDAHIAGLILNKRVFYIPKWLYRFL
jgi:Mrp family chromosome partitioning ATPase